MKKSRSRAVDEFIPDCPESILAVAEDVLDEGFDPRVNLQEHLSEAHMAVLQGSKPQSRVALSRGHRGEHDEVISGGIPEEGDEQTLPIASAI
jgi:hypothetical protein